MAKKGMIMRAIHLAPIAALATQLVACLPVDEHNKPPTAVAVAKVDGMAVGTAPIPFNGPFSLTLDGSASKDADGGKIVEYKWLRTDVTAAQRNALRPGNGDMGMAGMGGGAAAPSGPAFTGDPPATASPTVMITEKGKYRFSLWVKDDKGAYSAPASVSFEVGGFTPDAMCTASYMQPNMQCQACACTPTAMGGCLDAVNTCLNNSDADFAMLCKAIVDCSIAKKCSGAACATPDKCLTELTAAATFNGGMFPASCMGAGDSNPCAASAALGTCVTGPACMAVCGM
jgi:hypothetical protein